MDLNENYVTLTVTALLKLVAHGKRIFTEGNLDKKQWCFSYYKNLLSAFRLVSQSAQPRAGKPLGQVKN